MKKAQSASEFLTITIAVVFFMTLFFVAVYNNIYERNKEKEDILVREIALSVQNEIDLAYQSMDGYYREFRLSSNVYGKEYTQLSIEGTQDKYVVVSTSRSYASYEVKDVTASGINPGVNVIRKENGVVLLN